jgi:hypothetical protein
MTESAVERQRRLEVAKSKVATWTTSAERAERDGREADARRCRDKVRDWTSRVNLLQKDRIEAD